jgi:hypothetical protein
MFVDFVRGVQPIPSHDLMIVITDIFEFDLHVWFERDVPIKDLKQVLRLS